MTVHSYNVLLLSAAGVLIGFTPGAFAQHPADSVAAHRGSRLQQVARWTKSAEEQYQQGQWSEAEHWLDLAIAAQHDLIDAYFLRAKAREQQRNFAGAITDYTSVIHLQPEHYEARFQRALVLLEAQRYPEARADYQFLLEHPASATNAVYYQEETQNNARVVTGITTIQSDMRSEWLNAVGLTYYYESDYARSQAYFDKIISENPTYAAAYVNLGLTAEDQADTLSAIDYYQQALAHAPDNATALRHLASLARLRKDASLLEKINRQYGGESYEGLLQQGLTHLAQRDLAEAIEKFSQAISWQPASGEAHLQRAFAYEKAELLDEALADYTFVIKSDPLSEKTYVNRGNVYFKRERYALAVADYSRAIALNSENDRAHYNQGVAYQRLGQLEEACQHWHQALRLGNPDAVHPLESLCK